MTNKTNNANATETAVAEAVQALHGIEALRAIMGQFDPAVQAIIDRSIREANNAASALNFDEWGNIKLGASKSSLPSVLAILEAEQADPPLSVLIRDHLNGMNDAQQDCRNLRNNPPRRTNVGKNGEGVGTPIKMRNDSFVFNGLAIGGSIKAADTNAKRLRKLAAVHDIAETTEETGETADTETAAS